jgi:hypothetical protein
MEGVRLLENITKEQDEPYNGASELDSDANNPGLVLGTDHEYQDHFERPPWGGMIVYLNAILKLFGLRPHTNLYSDNTHLSRKRQNWDHIFFSWPCRPTVFHEIHIPQWLLSEPQKGISAIHCPSHCITLG